MSESKKMFSEEQTALLKKSAKNLKLALSNSKDPLADEFLAGKLGDIIDEIESSDKLYSFDDIPYFDLMTRDCLPEIAKIYFDFYSLAKYGTSAYE